MARQPLCQNASAARQPAVDCSNWTVQMPSRLRGSQAVHQTVHNRRAVPLGQSGHLLVDQFSEPVRTTDVRRPSRQLGRTQARVACAVSRPCAARTRCERPPDEAMAPASRAPKASQPGVRGPETWPGRHRGRRENRGARHGTLETPSVRGARPRPGTPAPLSHPGATRTARATGHPSILPSSPC